MTAGSVHPTCTMLGQSPQDIQCLRMSTLQVKEKGPPEHPLWKLRSKEEAQEFWEEEFGHLKSKNGPSSASQQQQEQKNEQRPRSFVASRDGQSPTFTAALAAMSGTTPMPDEARLRPSMNAPDQQHVRQKTGNG